MEQQTVHNRVRLPHLGTPSRSEPGDGVGEGDHGFSASEFSIVRRLATSPESDLTQLMEVVGDETGTELLEDLGRLWQKYVVDCVTFLDRERVKTVYSLTPEGREAFFKQLASFYEIPE